MCWELKEVATIVESCGDHILKNVKTGWILRFMPSKHVLSKYRALIMKMHADHIVNAQACHHFESLCDLELLWALICIIVLFPK